MLKSYITNHLAAAAAKLFQSCPTLCNPIDGSPWGSPVPGILQARTLEWVAISFSNAWKWKWSLSRIRLLVTPWTAAYQGPLSMGFSRQEYWSGLPLPSRYLFFYWCPFLFQEPTWYSIVIFPSPSAVCNSSSVWGWLFVCFVFNDPDTFDQFCQKPFSLDLSGVSSWKDSGLNYFIPLNTHWKN